MRVHILQHVPFEGLGSIAGWLEQQHAVVSWTRFHEAAPELPPLVDVDLVIALGGPMSVNDEDSLPWLRAEKRFVAETVRLGKPVLGICLGAQLIASALGARVYPGKVREIGWFPVSAMPVSANCFRFPDEQTVFHWHGETFDLPPGAQWLARSAACAHQAFQLGPRALGLQFHLETTPGGVADMLVHGASELADGGPFVQDAATLRIRPAKDYAAINTLMYRVLDYLTR